MRLTGWWVQQRSALQLGRRVILRYRATAASRRAAASHWSAWPVRRCAEAEVCGKRDGQNSVSRCCIMRPFPLRTCRSWRSLHYASSLSFAEQSAASPHWCLQGAAAAIRAGPGSQGAGAGGGEGPAAGSPECPGVLCLRWTLHLECCAVVRCSSEVRSGLPWAAAAARAALSGERVQAQRP